jgi:negative regulator of sigma E activity
MTVMPLARLDSARSIHQFEESQLAHEATGHDPTRYRHRRPLSHQSIAQPRMQLVQLSRCVGSLEVVRIGLASRSTQVLQEKH